MFLLNVKHQIPSTPSAFQSAVWLWHKKWYYSKSKLKFRKAQKFTVKAHYFLIVSRNKRPGKTL